MHIETGSTATTLREGHQLADPCPRIALDIPTPNRAAACRADMPSSDAFTTRDRRSPLNAFPIIHLLQGGS